jgi:hypothetical protein
MTFAPEVVLEAQDVIDLAPASRGSTDRHDAADVLGGILSFTSSPGEGK